MKSAEEHEKEIMDLIATYYDEVSEKILCFSSDKYRKLLQENSKLQNQFRVITEVFEYGKFHKENYSKDELDVIAKYYRNKFLLDDLERKEIYKAGFHAAIKMLYPFEKALQNSYDDSSGN